MNNVSHNSDRRGIGSGELHSLPLAMGVWAMSGGPSWGQADDNESIGAIQRAIDLGVNLLDTAPIYGLGHGETLLGRAIIGRRDRLLVSTKCGLSFPDHPGARPARDLSPENIQRECEASLRRLRTDWIDLYFCHWPDPNTSLHETVDALVRLLEENKIRAIGLANYSIEQISKAMEYGPISAIQVPASLLSIKQQADLLAFCCRHTIAFLAYSPLAKGLLTGKFTARSSFEGARAKDPDFLGERYLRNLEVVERIQAIARRRDKTCVQVALNYITSVPGLTAAIFGAKRISQVEENRAALGWALSDEDRAAIDLAVQKALG